MKLELMDKWCLVHGMDINKPHEYMEVNQQINIAAGGTMNHLDARELETIKLARMLQSHAESFNMPLPELKEANVIEAEANSKTQWKIKVAIMNMSRRKYNSPEPRNLSPLERNIVVEVAEGRTNKEIAKLVGVTENIVKNRIREIYEELGLDNRVELAMWQIRNDSSKP